MNTQLTFKITSFAAALVMNGLIVLGVGALFNAQPHQQLVVSASASTVVDSSHEVA